MKRLLIAAALLVAVACPAFCQAGFGTTGTSTLTVSIGTAFVIRVDNTSVTLGNGGGFTNYTGTTGFTYKIRSLSSQSPSITLRGSTDFAGTDVASVGPKIANSNLTYTCATGGSPMTACSGSQTASMSASTPVGTFSGGAKKNDGTGSVSWTLADSPTYDPDTYTGVVTFTASLT